MTRISLIGGLTLAVAVVFGAQTTPQVINVASFGPDGSTRVLTFDKFDSSLGTLTGVTISLTQKTWGGEYAVDNDGTEIASFEAHLGTSGYLTASGYTLPPEVLTLVNAQISSVGVLGAQDGDDALHAYNWDNGPDNRKIVGPAQGEPVTATSSGTLTGTGLSSYVGTGTLAVNYISNQASSHTSAGDVSYQGTPASAMATLTVTYTYDVVPEPTSLALLAFGCAAFGLRRRRPCR